ncbi:MAG: hypothetical protein PUE72_09895 [Lachnospiraceae bacterium]|nr:hypothetical protein [Lachnospiraceae bacterium]
MDDRSIRETIREEWKKLSKLSWGERIVYIWDYYKPLMVAIAGVILAISIGVSIYHNMQINTLLNAYFINCNALDADGDAIASDFAAYLGGIGEKDEIHVDTMTTLDDEDMSNYGTANQMKMTAYIAAGDVDVLLLNQSAYDKYDGSGAFADLTTILTKEQLADWSDLLVYGEVEKQTESEADTTSSDTAETISAQENTSGGTEVPVALKMQDALVIKEFNAYYDEPVYAVILGNSKHTDTAVEFLDYLLGGTGVTAED